MGVEYYVVCDDDRTGYELGKGAWSLFYEIEPFRSAADLRAAFELLIDREPDKHNPATREYLWHVCEQVVAYCEARSWRVRLINDCGDELVAPPERFERYAIRGDEKNLYRQVGTRYRD